MDHRLWKIHVVFLNTELKIYPLAWEIWRLDSNLDKSLSLWPIPSAFAKADTIL